MSVNWLYHRPERHDQQPNTTNFVGQKLVAVRGSGMGHNTADDGVADCGSAIIDQDQQRVDGTVTTLSKDGPAYSITADAAEPDDLLSGAENCGRTVSIGDQRQDAPAALNQSSMRTTATRPWSGLAPSLLAVSPTAVERQSEVQP